MKEDKECMGIMNYHCINELRESFPNQDYQVQMNKSPVCAATSSYLLFSFLDSRNPQAQPHISGNSKANPYIQATSVTPPSLMPPCHIAIPSYMAF